MAQSFNPYESPREIIRAELAEQPKRPTAERWWEMVHGAAISAHWTPDDVLVVERGLTLVDDFALIDADPEMTLEKRARLKINLSAEMRLMESSLGLSPAGRNRLRVEVIRAETAERRRSGAVETSVADPDSDELARRRSELRARIES